METNKRTSASKLVDDGHGNLTYRVNGACMSVHNDWGPGHREIVYQRALARKFDELGIRFEEQVPLAVLDGNSKPLIVYKVDFRVEGCIWIEIKSQRHQITGDEEAQLIDYFTADQLRTCNVGLLVNFGRVRLEWKRVFPPKNLRDQTRNQWGQRPK